MQSSNATILIVDDAPVQIELLNDILTYADYTVLIAEDGITAIDIAASARPDLILLDVMMPGMDGYETCRRLKDDPALRDIPVVFQTGRIDAVGMATGFAAGGADHISKPFRIDELLRVVRAQLVPNAPVAVRTILKIEELVR